VSDVRRILHNRGEPCSLVGTQQPMRERMGAEALAGWPAGKSRRSLIERERTLDVYVAPRVSAEAAEMRNSALH
jgi:hypothetical protein